MCKWEHWISKMRNNNYKCVRIVLEPIYVFKNNVSFLLFQSSQADHKRISTPLSLTTLTVEQFFLWSHLQGKHCHLPLATASQSSHPGDLYQNSPVPVHRAESQCAREQISPKVIKQKHQHLKISAVMSLLFLIHCCRVWALWLSGCLRLAAIRPWILKAINVSPLYLYVFKFRNAIT